MDLNQAYNLIPIGWNNPKRIQRSQIVPKYTCVISDLPRRINFCVNTLTYSFRFYLRLRLTTQQTWRSPIRSDPRNRDRFPDPRSLSLAQVESILFPVFCQINSNIDLSGATFIITPQSSTRFLKSPRTSASYNKSTNAADWITSASDPEDTLQSLKYLIPINSPGRSWQ